MLQHSSGKDCCVNGSLTRLVLWCVGTCYIFFALFFASVGICLFGLVAHSCACYTVNTGQVIGAPSSELAHGMAVTETQRLRRQCADLADQLPEFGERLRAATRTNDAPPPPELLSLLPVPSLRSLCAIPVTSVRHSWMHCGPLGTATHVPGWREVTLSSSPSRPLDESGWALLVANVSSDAFRSRVGGHDDTPSTTEPEAGHKGRHPDDTHTRASVDVDEDRGGASVDVDEDRGGAGLTESARRVLENLTADRLRVGQVPLWIQWDHVKTSHSTVSVALNTQDLPSRLRPYCALFTACIFELPLRLAGGATMPFQQVVSDLQAASVSTRASIGVHGGALQCGSFAQLIVLTLTVRSRIASPNAVVVLIAVSHCAWNVPV